MKELVSNTRIPFELTNEQRRYLGLLPVQDTWNLVCIAGKYLYFDGDIIRKEIQSNEMGNYYETELCEYTTHNLEVPGSSPGWSTKKQLRNS